MIRSIAKLPSTEQFVSSTRKFNSRLCATGKDPVDQAKNDQKVAKIGENTLQNPLLAFSDRVKPWSPLLRIATGVLALGGVIYTAVKDVKADIKDLRDELKTVNSDLRDNLKTVNSNLRDNLKTVNSSLSNKIQILDNKIQTLDNKIETVDNKIETVDSKIEAVDSKIEAVDRKIETVDRKINTVNTELGKKIDSVNSNIAGRLDGQSQRIDTLIQRIYGLEGNANYIFKGERPKSHLKSGSANLSNQKISGASNELVVPSRQSENSLLNKLDEYDVEILLNIIKEKRQDSK